MSYYTEIIVTPKDLVNRTILQANITVQRSNDVLLSATVYSAQSKPLEGAVVQVIKICGRNRINIGYVITNQDGEFAISVKKSNLIKYELDIYGPLIEAE
ncbi:hypothetical protein [[Clostridium] fimetarium]|uniref:Carboxypeptidase regulatory-like domain-containing protein n=1 Tax=[Clostridium] fimetarium TaxID=99656 RepID=A0A1I0Q8E0_9FIRM|nr:hypothetical protein [[Clostridium] fimetarium]SEW23285.1 hypothetical protein SAMN05421659_10789 [[Clostridium] fimetarium]